MQLAREESDALLVVPLPLREQPQFTVRYRVERRAPIGMWDNRITQHYVVNDFDGQRILHRVTVLGDVPEPAGDVARWDDLVRRPASRRPRVSG